MVINQFAKKGKNEEEKDSGMGIDGRKITIAKKGQEVRKEKTAITNSASWKQQSIIHPEVDIFQRSKKRQRVGFSVDN